MLSLGAVALIVLGYLLFTDPMSFFVTLLLLAVLGFILFYFGFIQVDKTPDTLDVTYTTAPVPEGAPAPSSADSSATTLDARVLTGPEVFHIADNVFTYDEARAVCKAYDAELASYPQIEQAYNSGAEWCGYGWSEGGLALYPTQEATWERLQKEQDPSKRIECGRPGINGGYFDPTTKFGVNCYGIKPQKKKQDTMSAEEGAFRRLVGQFKERIDKMLISPFNEKEWSERQVIHTSETPTQNLASIDEPRKSALRGVAESVGTTITNLVKDII